MSDLVQIGISSNAAAVAERVGNPRPMLEAIARAMDLENDLTVGHIQAKHLTGKGPYPPSEHRLGEVTEMFRKSLRRSAAVIEENAVTSGIGTNLRYAGVHEFGFDGNVTVRQYTRRTFDTFKTTQTSMDRWGHIRKRRIETQLMTGSITVRSFTRHMRMPERAPIRTGIEERAQNYQDSISAAIVAAWQEGGAK
jgi:phage gpG-like protein